MARPPGFAALFATALLGGCATPPSIIAPITVDHELTVRVDGSLFTQLRVDDATKPFLYPLIAPGGVPVTRGFPIDEQPGEARDHPHHLSLWFAHGDVDGHDFWHGVATDIVTVTVATRDDRIVTAHEWRPRDGAAVADEQRTMTFGATANDTQRWVDVDITLSPRGERMTFGDTKEGMFALRLAPTLRVEGPVAAGTLVDAEGRTDGDVWGKRARWVAARGPADDQDVTVAILDHPENPRHPTWWHARKYGLVAANPFGRRAFEGAGQPSGDLTVDGPIRFRYRVWLAAGRRSAAELDAAWTDYRGAQTRTLSKRP